MIIFPNGFNLLVFAKPDNYKQSRKVDRLKRWWAKWSMGDTFQYMFNRNSTLRGFIMIGVEGRDKFGIISKEVNW